MGSYWMGIFMYLLLLFILADVVVLVGSLTRLIPSPTPQNVHFYKGLAVLVLAVGIVCYGAVNAALVRNVSYEVKLDEASLEGFTIVMISDSHMGSANHFERNLERIVQAINDLNPDIVCLVGDIFNDDFNAIRDPVRAASLLKSIDSRYGVFACLGNHDGGSTLGQMIGFLEDSNITLLYDEYVVIDGRFVLVGRLDSSPIGGSGDLRRNDTADVLASISTELPIIVMEHNVSHIEEYGDNVDLIIAGHTHRGQLFPGSLITGAMYTVDYGHYQKNVNSPHVIVTSGVSTWGPPLRVGTGNEIVQIVLR